MPLKQQILEPEDKEARQERIRIALERMNSGTNIKEAPAAFNWGEHKTHPVEPPIELLSRVKAFLPQIKASNALLAQQAQLDPRSVDIEAIEAGDDRTIEMNLGLGVFTVRNRPSQSDGSESDSSRISDGSMSDSDSDDSDTTHSSTDTSSRPIPAPPFRQNGPRTSPRVEVLSSVRLVSPR